MYNAFWLKVTDVLKASLFGRFFLCVVSVIGSAFKESVFYSFFSKYNMSDYGSSSAIACFVRKLLFKSKLTDFVSDSVFVWSFSEMPKNVYHSSVSLISAYVLPAGLIMFVSGFGNISEMIISGLIILFAILLFGIKTTLASVIDNSFALSTFCNFFDIDRVSEPTKKYKKRFYAVTVSFGVIVGAISLILGFKLGIIAFAGVLLLPFLISSPILLITLTFIGGVLFSSMPAFILALLSLLVTVCRLLKKIDKLPPLRVSYILVLLYSAITLYFTFAGYAGSDSMHSGFIQFVLLSIFFSTVVAVNNYEKIKKVIFALSFSTVVPSIIGIYQMLTGQGGTGWTAEKYVGGLARISSTFANPNVYGEFLILTLCVTAVSVFISKGFIQKSVFLSVFGLQLVNLALTYSRGCYISVAFAALIVIWCCDKRLLGFGVFAVPLLPYVLPKNIITRIMSVGSYLKDSSVLYRFSIWEGSLRVIANNWFVGSGVGTAAFMTFYQNYMVSGTIAQHSHNTLMQIAIELSIVGLIVFMLILYYAVKDVSNVMRFSNFKAKLLVIPLLSAFAGIFIQCFVDYIFYNNVVFMVFWLVLGLLISGINVVSSDDSFAVSIKEGV